MREEREKMERDQPAKKYRTEREEEVKKGGSG